MITMIFSYYLIHIAQDFVGLVTTIKTILDAVSMNTSESDTSSMARDIAYYERSLALVSCIFDSFLTLIIKASYFLVICYLIYTGIVDCYSTTQCYCTL